MGHKVVCFNCKKALSIGTDFSYSPSSKCAICSNLLVVYNHKFKPPKMTDIKAWEVVEFLGLHGFVFQRIVDKDGKSIQYPTTMADAKEFVLKYKK